MVLCVIHVVALLVVQSFSYVFTWWVQLGMFLHEVLPEPILENFCPHRWSSYAA